VSEPRTATAGAPRSSEVRELFSLRRGIFSAPLGDGRLRLLAWPHADTIGPLSAGQRAVLRLLTDGPVSAEDLCAEARIDDEADRQQWVPELLDRLRAGGWLRVTVLWAGRQLYTIDPLRPPPAEPPPAPGPVVLSRFAVLRRQESTMLLESPRSWCEVNLHDGAAVAILTGTGIGRPTADGSPLALLPAEVNDRLTRDLHWAGMLVPSPDVEDTELRLRQWSPHELMFHDHSRMKYRGYFGDGFGGTFWARGEFDPVPARTTAFAGPVIKLVVPDLAERRRSDPSLTEVLEDRRSVRQYDDDHPITLDQLAEFLYRCARTRLVREREGVEYTSRPHPSGGSVYELELYLVVRHADGLAPGLYHYQSQDHTLELVREISDRAVQKLVRTAGHGSAEGVPPQVMVIVSARFGRLMWKYVSMGYALILKHVGVLYQTMYCVATAMELAPCGLGSGDSVAFAEATSLDEFTECSVGEFLIGSRPATKSVTADGAEGTVR
jgi:SagB-type dehydrogenase family enzyme